MQYFSLAYITGRLRLLHEHLQQFSYDLIDRDAQTLFCNTHLWTSRKTEENVMELFGSFEFTLDGICNSIDVVENVADNIDIPFYDVESSHSLKIQLAFEQKDAYDVSRYVRHMMFCTKTCIQMCEEGLAGSKKELEAKELEAKEKARKYIWHVKTLIGDLLFQMKKAAASSIDWNFEEESSIQLNQSLDDIDICVDYYSSDEEATVIQTQTQTEAQAEALAQAQTEAEALAVAQAVASIVAQVEALIIAPNAAKAEASSHMVDLTNLSDDEEGAHVGKKRKSPCNIVNLEADYVFVDLTMENGN